MAIATSVPRSAGWWLERAFEKRAARLPRLVELAAWHAGEPPAPAAVRNARDTFREFEEESTTNFAELITGSLRERMSVRDIRTAVSEDELDEKAWEHWRDNNLDVELASIIETMLWAGDSYAMVGKDQDTGAITVTAEDPRDLVTFHDPARQSRIICAVKFLRDEFDGYDYAVIMLPGAMTGGEPARTFVARRPTSGNAGFDKTEWSWDTDQGGKDGLPLEHHLVPVVRFRNRAGKGEYEPHLRLLRRIDRLVFQMTVIVMYQAFKQRAVMLDADAEEPDIQDDFKRTIGVDELDDVLTSDPGQWFLLPSGAKVWESTQADVQGILSAIKDEVMRLAAVTRRPMSIFAPDNQAAEGAKFTREGLTFAVEDKITRVTQGIVDMYHLIFLAEGDQERAKKSKMTVGWKPTERYSLADMGSATAQVAQTLPLKTILRRIWQMTPDEIAQVMAEQADQALILASVMDTAGTANA
ncbi:phage portal protein [Microbacterium sp. Kw_RZR3]|uniref:phage portal protein n=1 Tax=Microbacterium sp. Kw_RZR3 TaxID=3032903 RepID=UPI0023D9A45B|nr:phage portal protein [Microbacterium sp. Kw_RZR3]MDF2045141.1 phage portal protein [Microbacterium sp. Kw_RZR3]